MLSTSNLFKAEILLNETRIFYALANHETEFYFVVERNQTSHFIGIIDNVQWVWIYFRLVP